MWPRPAARGFSSWNWLKVKRWPSVSNAEGFLSKKFSKSQRAPNGFAQLDFTPAGTLVYITGSNTRGERSLLFLDASGKMQILPAAPAVYLNPRWSPDGSRIAVRIIDGSGTNLSMYEWATNRMTRLTFI